MQKIKNKFGNMSIRMRLLLLSIILSIVTGSCVVSVLYRNYKSTKISAEYLDHLSQINSVYELNENNLDVLRKLRKTDDKTEDIKQQFESNTSRMIELLNGIEDSVISSDAAMRVKVVKYLIECLNADYDKFCETSGAEAYSECTGAIDRINAYMQEILRISVNENKEYIEQVQSKNKNLWATVLFVGVAVVFVCGAINIVFSNYVTKIIKGTADITKEVTHGERTASFEIKNEPREVKEMLESFNELMLLLQEKNNMELRLAQDALEQARMQQLLKEAKLQGLQMQITPHFLFNTLNVISKMAFLENDDKVYHLIIALSKFLRHSLKNRQSNVLVSEEVDMIEQYLYILQARMGNRLSYTIDNQLEDGDLMEIPLFTLQPIVENAFKHGVENCINGGKIYVRIRKSGGQLVLTVADNGVGMDKESLQQLRKKVKIDEARFNYAEHIGIENVCCRLNMVFEKNVHIYVSSIKEKGTVFTIRINENTDNKVKERNIDEV